TLNSTNANGCNSSLTFSGTTGILTLANNMTQNLDTNGLVTFQALTVNASSKTPLTIRNTTINCGSGAVGLTLPSANCTLSGIGLVEQFSAIKTFSAAPVFSTATSKLLS